MSKTIYVDVRSDKEIEFSELYPLLKTFNGLSDKERTHFKQAVCKVAGETEIINLFEVVLPKIDSDDMTVVVISHVNKKVHHDGLLAAYTSEWGGTVTRDSQIGSILVSEVEEIDLSYFLDIFYSDVLESATIH